MANAISTVISDFFAAYSQSVDSPACRRILTATVNSAKSSNVVARTGAVQLFKTVIAKTSESSDLKLALDELLTLGEKVDRPSTIRNQARITAENARQFLDKVFNDVNEERFPGSFEVGTAQPVVDYLGSLGEEGLIEEQEGIVRSVVDEAIQADGIFRVKKNMVLFIGRKA